MSWAYDKKGMTAESVEMALKSAANGGRNEEVLGKLRRAYQDSGLGGYLKKQLEFMGPDPYGRAMIEARLGHKDEALKALETAYDERSIWIGYLKVDPALDNLRSDPQFQNLLRRMGLTP
jgi:hypothetical protein